MNARGRLALSALVLGVVVCGASQAGKHRNDAKTPEVDAPTAFVAAHNAVRAGVSKPANYTGTWTPIPPLAWSEELATGAQQWADHLRDDNKCKLVHSDVRLGENLAMGKDLDIAHAVQLWADEGKKFRWVPVYEFDIPTGHYSQVVWRKTTQVGCGWASCGKTNVFVCRYSPPGNHIDKAPY